MISLVKLIFPLTRFMSATSFANFDGKPPDDLAAALGLDADDEEGLAAGLG